MVQVWSLEVGNCRQTVNWLEHAQSLGKLNLSRHRWLGHMVPTPLDQPSPYTMFSEADSDWNKSQCGQFKKWTKGTKILTIGLSRIGCVELPGWDSCDLSNLELENLRDTVRCQGQWQNWNLISSASLFSWLIILVFSFVTGIWCCELAKMPKHLLKCLMISQTGLNRQ